MPKYGAQQRAQRNVRTGRYHRGNYKKEMKMGRPCAKERPCSATSPKKLSTAWTFVSKREKVRTKT
jgi:hypothetical protein